MTAEVQNTGEYIENWKNKRNVGTYVEYICTRNCDNFQKNMRNRKSKS